MDAVLEAMNRPLDSSIKEKRDYIAQPEIDPSRLPYFQDKLRSFLNDLANDEMAVSWSARTRLRASLDRVTTLMNHFKGLLSTSADTLAAAINARQSALRTDDADELLPDGVFTEQIMRGAPPSKTNIWSRRSSEHPKHIQGANPMHLIAFISDALEDLEDACVTTSDLPTTKENLSKLSELFGSLSKEYETEELSEAQRLAAIDRFAQRKLHAKPNDPIVRDFVDPARTVDWIMGCVDILVEVNQHVRELIGEYDKLSGSFPHPWLSIDAQEFLNQDQRAWPSVWLKYECRKHLAAFLKDGRSVKSDTLLLGSIAQLYDFIVGKPFHLYARAELEYFSEMEHIKQNDHKKSRAKARRLGVLDYEVNEAMKFACVFIRTLKLEGIIERYDETNLGYESERHGSKEKPTAYDIRRHQRSFWQNAPRSITDFDLVCKLGDLWKHDRQRKRSTTST
jgi:hypothetical protein